MVNSKISSMLATIRDDWTDDIIVANSYADYISNRISLITGIRNDIMTVITQLESDVVNDYNAVENILDDIINKQYSTEVINYIKTVGCTTITSYNDMFIPDSDGQVYSVREILSKYCYVIKNNLDYAMVFDVSNTYSKDFNALISSISTGIANNQVVISALQSLGSNEDASSYLSRLQASVGEDYTSVSQFAVSAYDCVKGTGRIVDKVNALLNPYVSTNITHNDATNLIVNNTDSNLYTGISPATFWIDASVNGIEAVFSTIVNSYELAWKVTIGILKAVASVFVSIWNKFLRKLFITDDINVNDNYNCEYLNIPYSSNFFPYDNSFSIKLNERFEQMFGATVTLEDIKTIFSTGYVLEVPFKFGCIRFNEYTLNDEPGILMQTFVRPNSPIQGFDDLTFVYNTTSSVKGPQLERSINDQFKLLFVNSSTEEVINEKQNDKFYWRAFKISLYRIDFVVGLIANLCCIASDSEFDKTGVWGIIDISDYSLLNPLMFGYYLKGLEAGNQYISPLVTNVISDNGGFLGFDRHQDPGEPNNDDFFNLITNKGSGGITNMETALSQGGIIFASLFYMPFMVMESLISWIYSTSASGMVKLYQQNIDVPSIFIPYYQNASVLEFKYTLQSDEQNRKAFNNALTTVVVTAVVITTAVFVTRKLISTKYALNANKLAAQQNVANILNDPLSSIEDKNKAIKHYQQSVKSVNRLNGLMSLSKSPTMYTSVTEEILQASDSNSDIDSKLDEIINLIH